jgi:GTP-binding protein
MLFRKKKHVTILPDIVPSSIKGTVPTLALVGRANVGKSTLFNCLTQSKAALTADMPGLTRDRHYGLGKKDEKTYIVIDTGGIDGPDYTLNEYVTEQMHLALQEATHIGLVVDARIGLTHEDKRMVEHLRRFNKPILLLVNKIDGQLANPDPLAEFAELGLTQIYPLSAVQGRGILELINALLGSFTSLTTHTTPTPTEAIKIAIIGRPNAGKSTLINQLLGENRNIVSNQPGTTRDSIAVDFQWHNQAFVLIDTAGIRRPSKIEEKFEQASIDQSIQAVYSSHLVILLIDATTGVTDQDLRLLQGILETGRGIIILFNKWECLSDDAKHRLQQELKWRLRFITFAKIGFISALQGKGMDDLFGWVQEVYQNATQKLSTSQLTRILQEAQQTHAPPAVSSRVIKLRYAHPGGTNPPLIVIHGTNTSYIPLAYQRYLEKFYRRHLTLIGTPLKLVFKEKNKNLFNLERL